MKRQASESNHLPLYADLKLSSSSESQWTLLVDKNKAHVVEISENSDSDEQSQASNQTSSSLANLIRDNASPLHNSDKQHIKKDLHNIALLMFLYFLQGVPLGLTGSLPFILSSRKVSYADQGTFSFAFWPFSLKLLWAPIVDSVYFRRIGRRKSWLVPMQYLIGIFMLLSAKYVHLLLEGNAAGNTIHDGTGLFVH
jgi:hypothetical protein